MSRVVREELCKKLDLLTQAISTAVISTLSRAPATYIYQMQQQHQVYEPDVVCIKNNVIG